MSNPNIVKAGIATRFGAGNCPYAAQRKASRPWSIRKEVRYMIGRRININDPHAIDKLVGRNPTPAKQIAGKLLKDAMRGCPRAFIIVTNMVDGKIPTTAAVDIEAIMAMSEQESDQVIAALESYISQTT